MIEHGPRGDHRHDHVLRALNTLGLGLVGVYAWRAYENTKRRPHALVRLAESFDGGAKALGQTAPDAGPASP